MPTNILDATHTYRGYRQQALYILWRVLSDTGELTYQPEGLEDLAVFNDNETLVEVTQVKAYSSNITLTTFDPKNRSGFFNRVHDYLELYPNLEINIASFGSYGNSLYQALISDGAERTQVSKKLSSYGNLSLSEAEYVLASIHPIQVSEQDLRNSISSKLKDSLLGEPTTAFDMLSYWIYLCSEHKHQISKQDVLTKINQIGQFINERAAHHREWFTSIIPLRDQTIDSELRIALQKRFYEGVSGRYEHILADLDVSRPQKLQQIHEAFENNDVVIIHGISGQGKTTLAFRYLHEYLPDQWRFFLHSPENRSHALSIATAIAHHAQVMNTPLVVYLDVKPSDTDWTETVRELAFIPNIRILVTIREDDLRRASFSTIDFPYTTIELQLSVDEAEEIYAQFVSTKQPTEFTDFESAWTRFGMENQGPLMEFIYLITQGTSLRNRLSQQIKALEDEVATDNLDEHILRVLRLVSIASAFGARLQRLSLVNGLSLKVPKRLIERLENEYLIKLDDEQLLIDGVHPIRSTIIKDLLVNEYTDWQDDIQICLNCIYEPDITTFLLELFVRESDQINDIIQALTSYYPETWTGVAGITRSLVWLGIKRFIDQNIHVLDKAYALFGKAGTMLLNSDIAGALSESERLIDKLGELDIARDAVEIAKELKKEMDGHDKIFTYITTWLSDISQIPDTPEMMSDWNGLAESIFWLHHLQIDIPTDEWISDIDFNIAIPKLPLEVLSDIGSAFAHTKEASTWHTQYRDLLLEHFKKNTNTVRIETTEEAVNLHYIFDIQATYHKDGVTDPIHHESLQRLRWFADLFPEYETVRTQGYGHRIIAIDVPDSSHKKINRKNLPRKWLVWVNSVYSGLFYWQYRPTGWQEYSSEVIDLRQEMVRLLIQYERGVEKYFQRKNPVNLHSKLVIPYRQSIMDKLKRYPPLPKSVVDPWGITKEGSTNNNSIAAIFEPKGILFEKFIPYADSIRKYMFCLANFIDHSEHALAITEQLRILNEEQRSKYFELAINQGIQERLAILSIDNLFDARKILDSFQQEFRRLLLPFVDNGMLSRLERQEQQVYERLWGLWYFFVLEPYHLEKNPRKRFSSVFQQQFEHYMAKIKSGLESEISGENTVETLNTALEWEQELTQTILINSSNGWNLYEQLSKKLQAILVEALIDVQLVSSSYLKMQRLLIVPLINGKMPSKVGYYFHVTTLLSTQKPHEMSFAPKSLPDEIIEQLEQNNILLHEGQEIALTRSLIEEVAKIHAMVAHIYDLVSIPELEVDDLNTVQAYVTRTVDNLSDVINKVMQLTKAVAEILNNFTFASSENQNLALEALQLLRRNLLSDEIGDDGRIQLDKLEGWRNQLVNVLDATFALCTTIASEM